MPQARYSVLHSASPPSCSFPSPSFSPHSEMHIQCLVSWLDGYAPSHVGMVEVRWGSVAWPRPACEMLSPSHSLPPPPPPRQNVTTASHFQGQLPGQQVRPAHLADGELRSSSRHCMLSRLLLKGLCPAVADQAQRCPRPGPCSRFVVQVAPAVRPLSRTLVQHREGDP